MERASQLFEKLTLGSFAGLKVGYDEGDRPQLRCVRESGEEPGTEGLSAGTRDQLYLALRIASLERFSLVQEPLPLVCDDILVHFDDARARVALELLAGLSEKVQVLLFSHHQRIVELARSVLLEGERLRVHELRR